VERLLRTRRIIIDPFPLGDNDDILGSQMRQRAEEERQILGHSKVQGRDSEGVSKHQKASVVRCK
jgi:hypothetical protein